MSRSSSGSWSGGGAAPPADIIDLDRFMRSARPSHPRIRSALVVDAGGPRLPQAASSSTSSGGGVRSAARAKRHSHDSGLSDGSYGRRRQRPHRRVSCGETHRPKAEPRPTSTSSLHAFRAVCERALLDQQQQIARVAQLCERLTERRPTTDSSGTSSSSRSTRDQRRKDKHRTEECKTYKIIMTKLDELNRLFAMRATSPQARAASRPGARSLARARAPDSASASVSVSDKLVATEAISVRTNSVSPTRAEERARRLAELRAVAAGPALDIAPHSRRPNVLTESVVKCDASDESGASVAGDARFDFNLNDPVHLYAQARRLPSLHASSPAGRGATLCALCRGYLRALRHYLAAQLCYPAEPCAS